MPAALPCGLGDTGSHSASVQGFRVGYCFLHLPAAKQVLHVDPHHWWVNRWLCARPVTAGHPEQHAHSRSPVKSA